MKKSLWRLVPVLALLLMGAAKKEPEFTVRFYGETSGQDASFAVPVPLQDPPRKIFISKISDISERDVIGIYPFQTADGAIGCVFFLNDHGTTMLDTLSIEKRGKTLIALVNGRLVVDMVIDRRVSDGIITIPHGLTPEEGLMLRKHFKVVNMPAAKQQQ